MVLTGFTLENGVYTPNAIAATGGGTVDDTYSSTSTSTNALQHAQIAAEFTRLVGNSPANGDTLEDLNTRLNSISSGLEYKGSWNLTGALLPTESELGKMYSLMGTTSVIDGTSYRPGMLVISNKANPGNNVSADWDVIDLTQSLSTLTQAQITDSTSTVAGALTGVLFEAAATNWYQGKVDQTFDNSSTSINAISHAAIVAMRTALLGGVPESANTLNKINSLIGALTNRVTALETNKVVTTSNALPTQTLTSLFHITEDADPVTDGDTSRFYWRIGSNWYGGLLPSDFENN